MDSYLRLVLDDIFGNENLINTIVWKRRGGVLAQSKQFGAVTDSILFYAKSSAFKFHPPTIKEGAEEYVEERFKYKDEKGRRYRLSPIVSPSYSPTLIYEYKGYQPPRTGWSCSPETMARWESEGKLVFPKKKDQRIQRKQYLDEWEGRPMQSLWADIPPINPQAIERLGYATQKPESLVERIIEASSDEGDLVADFFCGSGTTGAVAERLGRRWLMSDLGRFAIHTSRKRLIETQRSLHDEGKTYRAIDVYNLGRYERQWWQKDRLKGAEEEHRRIVLEFFKAEILTSAPSPLLHGRKGTAFCHVDGIDGLFTRDELSAVVLAALGITDEEDAWTRYALKMATGSGKTKVMSLAIVWSYFHALRESESPLAKHFVVIAPNLTVFERLKEDFKPEGGGPDIFDNDPLIPTEWRGDWNLTTVLQDEAGGAHTGATLYLTNIHRLFDNSRKRESGEMHDWIGPNISQSKALDTGAALRDRITGHQRLIVLNDEAHHVWDPDSAWNEAIEYLDSSIRKRGGDGIAAQLDFSATPKDDKANYFKHIICDTPLGEAVDAGIVKTPIIGKVGQLHEQATDNATVTVFSG